MSYALLGNLPPIMGLYAATIAGYVYTLLGSSGQLTIGPVALVRKHTLDTNTSTHNT
jgi:SulP family sulfate permease